MINFSRKFLSLFLIPFLYQGTLWATEVSFQKKSIAIGTVTIQAEIADTPEKTARGLMFRTALEDGHGMLFVFEKEETRNFWMKNTFIPLSIGFFNAKKQLIDVQDMKPVGSEMETNIPSYSSAGPAKYALEVPLGWFTKKKIKFGSRLKFLK